MNGDTPLLRQVNPSFIKNGRITSQVFRPTPKDKNQLSVYDGDMITPEASWKHFTSTNLRSVGVMAITVSECETHQLRVVPDPKTFQEHVLIDFSGMKPGQIEATSKNLKSLAEARQWLFQPPKENHEQ